MPDEQSFVIDRPYLSGIQTALEIYSQIAERLFYMKLDTTLYMDMGNVKGIDGVFAEWVVANLSCRATSVSKGKHLVVINANQQVLNMLEDAVLREKLAFLAINADKKVRIRGKISENSNKVLALVIQEGSVTREHTNKVLERDCQKELIELCDLGFIRCEKILTKERKRGPKPILYLKYLPSKADSWLENIVEEQEQQEEKAI